MIKFFYRLFNHDKIEEQQKTIDVYRKRVEQLEAEVREYKGYKLKYKVAQMLVDDDPAIDELLDAYNKKQKEKKPYFNPRWGLYSAGQSIAQANHGVANAMANIDAQHALARQQAAMLGSGLLGIGANPFGR